MLKHHFKYIFTALAVSLAACSDDEPIAPVEPEGPQLTPDDELLYHDYVRTDVYPKLNNEVYLNPPPLLVPNTWRRDSLMQFEVSDDAGFSKSIFLSEPRDWSMASPHKRLEPGRWYWRYRCVAADGTAGTWSDAIAFNVDANLPEFATPTIEEFNAALPTGHPRLDCYIDANLESARAGIKNHSEYKALTARATTAMNLDYSDISTYYSNKNNVGTLNSSVNHLYQAWVLTQDEQYAEKLLYILRAMIARPATDDELFNGESNFQSGDLAQCYVRIYDSLFDRLTQGERAAAEEFMLRILHKLLKAQMGQQDNLFNSHFWQHNMMCVFQCAYMLHDKMPYREEAIKALDFYYELWTTRAPGSGYNRDGVWHNSASYFDTNMETLHYMPLVLTAITGFDFLSHPWYRNAGKSIPYTWPTASKSLGFGDGSDAGTPSRLRVAMADFLARHTGDEYAGWYAEQNRSLLTTDYLFRLDRVVNSYAYSTSQPDDIAKLIWYKDTGEAVVHSDLADIDNDLAVSFKSSRFGCTQHTYANQNAFNIVYRGADVFRNTGHYFKYASPHHIMDNRHSRAHNTILVDGIGQAFAPEAFGNIVRGIESDNVVYIMGDASHAYTDSCHLKVWINNFKNAGLTQSRENGFGSTPLSLYQRHVLMLGGSVVVVYDDIATSEPAAINWMLNNRDAFDTGADGSTFTVENTAKNFAADARLLCSVPFTHDETTEFFYPTPSKTEYPDHWHYMATTQKGTAFRFLFVLKVRDLNEPATVIEPDASGTVSVDGWTIRADFSGAAASLAIDNATLGASFTLSPEGGVIRDTVDGKASEIESTDYLPLHSRSI